MAYNPSGASNSDQAYSSMENESVELLSAMMGGDIDLDLARRLLRKCNGDVQKAADALLEGTAKGMLEETAVIRRTGSLNTIRTDERPRSRTAGRPGTPVQPSVIDLTGEGEDDELSRALNLSMETHSNEQSTRVDRDQKSAPPDPAWAMVRSNEPTHSAMSQDDQSLSRAIEASFKDFAGVNEDDTPPLEDTIREGNRPVVLRTESPTLAYAALVLQALFFVPQVRITLSKLSHVLFDVQNEADRTILSLIELYAHMDLGALGALLGNDILCGFEAKPFNGPSDSPGELSSDFLKKAATFIDDYVKQLDENGDPKPFVSFRLFNFRHGSIVLSPAAPNGVGRAFGETSVVSVDVNCSRPSPNTLMSRLSTDLSEYVDGESKHDIIVEPSQVVVFGLKHGNFSSSSIQEPFTYPKSIYMDQFLGENLKLTNEKRVQQQQIRDRLQELATRKQTITRSSDTDGLQALRDSMYYYEHLADAKGDPERKEKLTRTLAQLQAILTTIEKEAEGIDAEVAKLKEEESKLFDCPELQHHKYDLRAVCIHTGIPGRKHTYLYVHHDGEWWKMVDTEVTKVADDAVLTDTTGLHLGAGPYLLFYSRSLPEDSPAVKWPSHLEDEIRANNTHLIESLKLTALANTDSALNTPVPSGEAKGAKSTVTAPTKTESTMDLSK
ncbi:hypothetical protein PC9H_000524 [Pleurotus ostreatus]|uniref:USP domain-containing protein n=1 Tax=Pleurotus ostreatus TaxID=5322 RepID=A0A8H7DWX1_PLEOS|nr:uncharacterized protein PC9H_000524 [Pleurotus ostreatus]KAF7440180.1 hypothetical protein PC9H_000524 [Pleurotus ostreatus]